MSATLVAWMLYLGLLLVAILIASFELKNPIRVFVGRHIPKLRQVGGWFALSSVAMTFGSIGILFVSTQAAGEVLSLAWWPGRIGALCCVAWATYRAAETFFGFRRMLRWVKAGPSNAWRATAEAFRGEGGAQ